MAEAPAGGAKNADSCVDCPAGAYCPQRGMTEPLFCPTGTYLNSTGSKRISDCEKCPAGTFSEARGATSNSSCKSCRNTFPTRPNSLPGSISEQACTSDSSCNTTDYVSADGTCSSCPPGHFCDGSSKTECGLGDWCLNGKRHKCPKGTANAKTKQNSSSACIQCEAGEYNSLEGQYM